MISRTPGYAGPERRKSPRWQPSRLRLLFWLLALLAVVYAAAVLYLVGQETTLVFQAGRALGPTRPPFQFGQVDLPRKDGARQFAWVMRQRATDEGPWVLFLHGNAATIASNVNISHYRQLRGLGLNIMAPEYRGFGGLDGHPTERALAEDARVAYDYLVVTRRIAPSRVVIYGWSLGSAVAVNLASRVEEAGLILEGAPASLVDIGQRQYPFFPVRLIMRNPFNSIQNIDRVNSPILFLHSPEDTVIPIEEGRRLFNAARGEKTFVEVRGGHVHASEVDTTAFDSAMRPFLQRVLR